MATRRASVALAACASGFFLYHAGKKYFFRVDPGGMGVGSGARATTEEGRAEGARGEAGVSRRRKKGPAINKIFLRQLLKLLKISIPSILSKEFGLLSLHTSSLVARTFLSIYVASLDGQLVKAIVEGNVPQFLALLFTSRPGHFCQQPIRYLECKLALAIRTRLVNYAYLLYFQNQTYYRVSNLDTRLANPDHSLTEDIQAFSSAVTYLLACE